MTQRALIGTAFEWASVNTLAVSIYNDIQKLLQYQHVTEMSMEDIKKITDVQQLLSPYVWGYTASGLDKKLSESPATPNTP